MSTASRCQPHATRSSSVVPTLMRAADREQTAAERAWVSATVRAAQAGDFHAMADLLDILAPLVGRVCGPIALRDGPDAAQEALIAVFRNLRSLRDPATLHAWVRVIAVRDAVRVAGRARRAVPTELADLPAPGDPHLRSDVRDVLQRLSPEYRAILVLRALEGFDEQQAARVGFVGGLRPVSLPALTGRSRARRPPRRTGPAPPRPPRAASRKAADMTTEVV